MPNRGRVRDVSRVCSMPGLGVTATIRLPAFDFNQHEPRPSGLSDFLFLSHTGLAVSRTHCCLPQP